MSLRLTYVHGHELRYAARVRLQNLAIPVGPCARAAAQVRCMALHLCFPESSWWHSDAFGMHAYRHAIGPHSAGWTQFVTLSQSVTTHCKPVAGGRGKSSLPGQIV